jgi:hypothetical protein
MKVQWPKPNRALGVVDALGILAVLAFLVGRYVPVARLPFWRCAIREATGWPCPGCGLTRVVDHLSHGHLGLAWQANPLGTFAGLLLAGCALLAALHLLLKLPLPSIQLSPREGKWCRIALAAAFVANYAFVVVKTRFPQLLQPL